VTDSVGDATRAAFHLMAREHVEMLPQRLAAGASAAVLDAVALSARPIVADAREARGRRLESIAGQQREPDPSPESARTSRQACWSTAAPAPARAAEHMRAFQPSGALERLY
jgi:hypothetical protein